MKYLPVSELLFLGHCDCSAGYDSKEEAILKSGDSLYVTIDSDPFANHGMGVSTIYFRGREIASETMHRPNVGIELTGPSIGLYEDAERWLLRNLASIV